MASIFGSLGQKARSYIDEHRNKKKEEERESQTRKTNERIVVGEQFSNEQKTIAIEHQKNKAREVLENPNAHLSKKIAAINELYKDHSKPKGSNATQEIHDRAYVNRYRRDMRIEKNRYLKELVAQEKVRKQMESINKRIMYQERNAILKAEKSARNLIMKAKVERRL